MTKHSGLIATGVNAAGYREILGLGLGDSESEATWTMFLQGLKDRGLHGVDGEVSDDHRGLVNAVQRQFQGATWQRCQTHYAEGRIMPRQGRQPAIRLRIPCGDTA